VTLDRLVVARGAAAGLVLGVPTALANVVLAGQDPKPKAALNLTFLILLAAFALAGFLAGREARSDAARHGAAAAFVAFVLVQVIGVLGRLDRGDSVAPAQIVVLGLLATLIGSITATAAARNHPPEEQA